MNKKIRTQNRIILLINIIALVIFSLIFYSFWYGLYHEVVYFYQKANWVLLGVYIGILALFMQIYGICSQMLSLVFSCFFLYIQVSLVAKELIKIDGFLLIFIVSSILSIMINHLNHRIFYLMYPPKKTIILYQGDLGNLNRCLLKYQSDNFDIKDIVEISGKMNIDNIIKNYESIIISKLDLNLKDNSYNFCLK